MSATIINRNVVTSAGRYGALYNWYSASRMYYSSGWFLPSKDELNAMYTNLAQHSVGGFGAYNYWSSSEQPGTSPGTAWGVQFGGSGNMYGSRKINPLYTRPCRTFTSEVGRYSLRDVGPTGGWIFYIDGTTYFEAAPSDGPSVEWSNIYTEIGATAQGTAIGTGQSNTTAIIGQSGHISSAASESDACEVSMTIAPYGWHVPTEVECLELSRFLDPSGYWSTQAGCAVNKAADRLKEVGTQRWNNDTGVSNTVGFLAAGAGMRYGTNGTFGYLKQGGGFWLSNNAGAIVANINCVLSYIPGTSTYYGSVFGVGENGNHYTPNSTWAGYPIRCVKDDEVDPGSVIDYDGNIYHTVKIGGQVWMVENLRTTHMPDGTPIPIVTSNSTWIIPYTYEPKMCYYNNNIIYA